MLPLNRVVSVVSSLVTFRTCGQNKSMVTDRPVPSWALLAQDPRRPRRPAAHRQPFGLCEKQERDLEHDRKRGHRCPGN